MFRSLTPFFFAAAADASAAAAAAVPAAAAAVLAAAAAAAPAAAPAVAPAAATPATPATPAAAPAAVLVAFTAVVGGTEQASGSCAAADLEAALQLLHLLFVAELRWDEGRLETVLSYVEENVRNQDKDPQERLRNLISHVNTQVRVCTFVVVFC